MKKIVVFSLMILILALAGCKEKSDAEKYLIGVDQADDFDLGDYSAKYQKICSKYDTNGEKTRCMLTADGNPDNCQKKDTENARLTCLAVNYQDFSYCDREQPNPTIENSDPVKLCYEQVLRIVDLAGKSTDDCQGVASPTKEVCIAVLSDDLDMCDSIQAKNDILKKGAQNNCYTWIAGVRKDTSLCTEYIDAGLSQDICLSHVNERINLDH